MRLAAGLDKPSAGTVKASGDVKYLGPDDALNLPPAPVLLIDQTFARNDLLARERAAIALDRIRRAGATTLLVSHDDGPDLAGWPMRSGGCTKAAWPAAAIRTRSWPRITSTWPRGCAHGAKASVRR